MSLFNEAKLSAIGSSQQLGAVNKPASSSWESSALIIHSFLQQLSGGRNRMDEWASRPRKGFQARRGCAGARGGGGV